MLAILAALPARPGQGLMLHALHLKVLQVPHDNLVGRREGPTTKEIETGPLGGAKTDAPLVSTKTDGRTAREAPSPPESSL